MNTWKGEDFVSVFDGSGTFNEENLIQQFEICDDCREAYPTPTYYTFDREACIAAYGSQHDDCTGNLCPDCADRIIPDNSQDPRATPEVRQMAKDMGF